MTLEGEYLGKCSLRCADENANFEKIVASLDNFKNG